MRTLQRVGAGLLALTLAGGITACGDDDDDEGTTDTTAADSPAEGDTAAFCDAMVEFNSAVSDVEFDESTPEDDVKAAGEQLAPLTETIAANAPDDLSGTAEEIDTVVQALLAGDASAFGEDATFATYTELLEGAVESCGFEQVDVTGKDYAFEAPDTIAAGTVSFAFTNASEGEAHEMLVLQKADGVDLTWDEILALGEEEGESKTKFVTAAFAEPGGSGGTLATFAAGDYVMICTIPVGGEEGPPHFTQGMVHEFTVE